MYKDCSEYYITKALSVKDDVISTLSRTIESLTLKLAPIGASSILGEWNTVSMVAETKSLTSDAIRKQLQNGEFEYGVDFKHNGGKILIHQGAIGRLHRRRG